MLQSGVYLHSLHSKTASLNAPTETRTRCTGAGIEEQLVQTDNYIFTDIPCAEEIMLQCGSHKITEMICYKLSIDSPASQS